MLLLSCFLYAAGLSRVNAEDAGIAELSDKLRRAAKFEENNVYEIEVLRTIFADKTALKEKSEEAKLRLENGKISESTYAARIATANSMHGKDRLHTIHLTLQYKSSALWKCVADWNNGGRLDEYYASEDGLMYIVDPKLQAVIIRDDMEATRTALLAGLPQFAAMSLVDLAHKVEEMDNVGSGGGYLLTLNGDYTAKIVFAPSGGSILQISLQAGNQPIWTINSKGADEFEMVRYNATGNPIGSDAWRILKSTRMIDPSNASMQYVVRKGFSVSIKTKTLKHENLTGRDLLKAILEQ